MRGSTHLVACEKQIALYYGRRSFTTCAVSSLLRQVNAGEGVPLPRPRIQVAHGTVPQKCARNALPAPSGILSRPRLFPVMPMTKYMLVFSLLFLQRYGDHICSPFLHCGATLSMAGDEKCLVLFHGLGQLLKVGLSELSRQEVCPAIRMYRIPHHSLVVIR
jgi:hypothetical protein